MGTAGDDFLRNTLSDSGNISLASANPSTGGSGRPVSPPDTPPGERGTEAQAEIDKATRQAREAEQNRVQNGPPPWWDPIADPAKAGSGASGPGGYTFDAETMTALIGKWEKFRDDIQDDGRRLLEASQLLRPPSPDQPATEQAQATTSSIHAAIENNMSMSRYAQSYIDSLHKANGTYVQQEENVSGALYGDTSGDLYK